MVLRDVHSQLVYLQEESLPWFWSAIQLSAWALFMSCRKIKYDRRNSERKKPGKLSSWRKNMLWLNVKHYRKSSWRHTEKLSSRGAFLCPTWLIWNKLAASKTLLWRRQKNSWVSQSTGKGNVFFARLALFARLAFASVRLKYARHYSCSAGYKNLTVLTGWSYSTGSLNEKMTDWSFVQTRI